MSQKMGKKDSYISLKEASKITGYSSDYIGQLIRAGKVPGKQMYTNVSWVTTEEAILEYFEKAKKGERIDSHEGSSRSGDIISLYLIPFYKTVLTIAAIVLLLLTIFLIYVLFVTIERSVEQKTLSDHANVPAL